MYFYEGVEKSGRIFKKGGRKIEVYLDTPQLFSPLL